MWTVFLASSVGALVPIIFGNRDKFLGGATVPYAEAIYICLAGYLATFVFEVRDPNHGFLFGLGMDLVLRTVRHELFAPAQVAKEEDCDEE